MKLIYKFIFLSTVVLITCDKESYIGPNTPSKSQLINFFPIVKGNKWIYSTSYSKNGTNESTILIKGKEVVEIIDYYPPSDSFYIQIVTDATETIQTDSSDSIITIKNKIDTLLMAMNDSCLEIITSTIEPLQQLQHHVPLTSIIGNRLRTILPDTSSIQLIKRSYLLGEVNIQYTIVKGIGFLNIWTNCTWLFGGSGSEIKLKEFIPAIPQ